MMIGYYDRNGYAGLFYSNLLPGGLAEMNTFGNPAALANGMIASPGHIADFYKTPPGYGGSGDDNAAPWHAFNCLADFMGTSQDLDLARNMNVNGTTTWYYNPYGAQLAFSDLGRYPTLSRLDGMYGVGEYVRHCGYSFYDPNPLNMYDDMLYSQLTYNIWGDGNPFWTPDLAFTFDDFKAEIDAGRPVIVQVAGHSMLGYDYIAGTGVAPDRVRVYDTWGPNGQNPGVLDWNGTYNGMQMYGVMVFEPDGGAEILEIIPEPATLAILGAGLLAAAWRRRRR
jgi:hypothetical protein